MNQKGFATLEVILMVMVIGILASIAVPRFGDVTTKANTAKVQSDLATLDNAIQIYYMENGDYPKIDQLKAADNNYISNLKAPTGNVYVNGNAEKIADDADYSINDKHRATLNIGGTPRTIDDIVLPKDKPAATGTGT